LSGVVVKSADGAQDAIKQARSQQIKATDLLARLLQAPQSQAVASEHVDSLTEEFFVMSSTYLEMVRRLKYLHRAYLCTAALLT